MTKPRFRTTGYVTFIVEPVGDFDPTNWRQTPADYRVVDCKGPAATLGQADSWKFLYNQSAIKSKSVSRWAVHFSLKDPVLRNHVAANGSALPKNNPGRIIAGNRATQSALAGTC